MNGSLRRRKRFKFVRQELAEILHDDICALFAKRIGLAPPVHANHEPESACLPGPDTSQCILDDDGAVWFDGQTFRGFPERVWGRLSGKPESIDVMAVDADVKQRRQADGIQDFGTMMAGGHDGQF